MSLFRKHFYRKAPDRLVEISEHVYDDEYKLYLDGIVAQLHDHYPDASFMVCNFRAGYQRSRISTLLSQYRMWVMDYPNQQGSVPVLPLQVISQFLISSESWLDWYHGDQKTLELAYNQGSMELLRHASSLNPRPSQLRYLQYISTSSEWPSSEAPLLLDCLILKGLSHFEWRRDWRPSLREECILVMLDIQCRVQGDVVLEFVNLSDNLVCEEMIFRIMFHTAFVRGNVLKVRRTMMDILWDAKDEFPKELEAELLFSNAVVPAMSTAPPLCPLMPRGVPPPPPPPPFRYGGPPTSTPPPAGTPSPEMHGVAPPPPPCSFRHGGLSPPLRQPMGAPTSPIRGRVPPPPPPPFRYGGPPTSTPPPMGTPSHAMYGGAPPPPPPPPQFRYGGFSPPLRPPMGDPPRPMRGGVPPPPPPLRSNQRGVPPPFIYGKPQTPTPPPTGTPSSPMRGGSPRPPPFRYGGHSPPLWQLMGTPSSSIRRVAPPPPPPPPMRGGRGRSGFVDLNRVYNCLCSDCSSTKTLRIILSRSQSVSMSSSTDQTVPGWHRRQLQDHFPYASFLVFNFREGDQRSQISDVLSQHDMTVMDYPSHYQNCPLLPLEMIHHFLKSSESWLSLEGQPNVLLMHCEKGGWPVLAFMLSGLLLYRKQYQEEQKTLEMDPKARANRSSILLFSTPKTEKRTRLNQQDGGEECTLVKLDIQYCRVQGDVVLECIILHDDLVREEMVFRVMFNTAFVRGNVLIVQRDEMDMLWDAKDQFPKEFN
ncbi:hypothetical protein Bca4012_046710 [Brassica carinata]